MSGKNPLCQIAGGAETDARNGFYARGIIKQNAAAAVDLNINKPRRKQSALKISLGNAAGQVTLRYNRAHAAIFDKHTMALNNTVLRQDATICEVQIPLNCFRNFGQVWRSCQDYNRAR